MASAAPANHEAVTVGIEGAARTLRRVVIFARHRAHRIEQARQRPVEFLSAAAKHHILLTQRDLLRRHADAVERSRTG